MKIKKVLVSQPKPTSEKSPYFDIAEKYGVKIDFRPFIKVESLSAKEFRQQKVSILDHTAVVFTSRHAIDHFFSLCSEMRITIPETMKYFCTSETIALYIQKYVQYRKRKVFFVAHSQAFVHCGRFPTAASRRSLGRVSVPMWPISLSTRLCIIALVSRYLTN